MLVFSAGGDGGSGLHEHDYLERRCGGRALPWHRADVGFFGAHALSRCVRVARMDSCDPLLATHFLLEKQVEGARSRSVRHYHGLGRLLINAQIACLGGDGVRKCIFWTTTCIFWTAICGFVLWDTMRASRGI